MRAAFVLFDRLTALDLVGLYDPITRLRSMGFRPDFTWEFCALRPRVTDDRGFGADWTATVSSTGFATGAGTQAETIPAGAAHYLIAALSSATGPATFTPVPSNPAAWTLLEEAAGDLVSRLALAKAREVASHRQSDWVLGADTVVEIDGDILGKPTDAAEASAMLGRLAGREHRVSTGFALLAPGGALSAAEVVVTRVRFRPLAAGAIAARGLLRWPAEVFKSFVIKRSSTRRNNLSTCKQLARAPLVALHDLRGCLRVIP